jgi:hypothetical protein
MGHFSVGLTGIEPATPWPATYAYSPVGHFAR